MLILICSFCKHLFVIVLVHMLHVWTNFPSDRCFRCRASGRIFPVTFLLVHNYSDGNLWQQGIALKLGAADWHLKNSNNV